MRYVLEGLTEKYDVSRIPIARERALKYIDAKMVTIPLDAVQELLRVVLMGQIVPITAPVSYDPLLTFDDLQRQGLLWMTAIDNHPGTYHVIVPMLALKFICLQHSHKDVGVGRVSHMLSLLEHRDGSHFEEFLGHYHSFLNCTMALKRSTVSLGGFYKGLRMHPEVAAIQLKLDAKKDYETLRRLSGKDKHQFPLAKFYTTDPQRQQEAVRLTSELLDGKVVVNSHGASIDLLQVDPLTSGGLLVRAFCVFHTEGHNVLQKKKVDQDRKKALLAVRDCQQLVTAVNNPKNLMCVTVHITNGRVADDILDRAPPPYSIVIGSHNSEAFFGPVLSRGIMSRAYLTAKVRKAGFCTLGQLQQTKKPSHLPMCIGLQVLTRGARLLFK